MVQVIGARGKTYKQALNDVMEDNKPHETIYVKLTGADITPMKLISPDGVGATTWDYSVAASATTTPKDIAVVQIPIDYVMGTTNRSGYDKASVFAAASIDVPAIPLEVNDIFHLTTAVNCTGFDEGCMLICGTDDIVAIDYSPDALTTTTHIFKLLFAISTTEIVVQYMGLGTVDLAA